MLNLESHLDRTVIVLVAIEVKIFVEKLRM